MPLETLPSFKRQDVDSLFPSGSVLRLVNEMSYHHLGIKERGLMVSSVPPAEKDIPCFRDQACREPSTLNPEMGLPEPGGPGVGPLPRDGTACGKTPAPL